MAVDGPLLFLSKNRIQVTSTVQHTNDLNFIRCETVKDKVLAESGDREDSQSGVCRLSKAASATDLRRIAQ